MAEKQNKYYSDSIFWVEVDRIKPNPFQPRKSFDEAAIRSLADSIRQYGVLQPLTVTKKEIERPDEGIFVEYELIAGERRLRASKVAGVSMVPVVIRNPEEGDKMKLEIAIIENLQREDLNAVDRGRAFQQLVDEFGMTHLQVAQKVGKSREYVSNTLRILQLPEEILNALVAGQISDGHTRPLLMLADRPEQQQTMFKEIVERKMTVREAERVARRIAVDKARKQILPPEMMALERELTEQLGTRVRIERKEKGGKVLIDFFSDEDLGTLRERFLQAISAATPVAAASGTAVVPPDAAGAITVAEPSPEEHADIVEDNPQAEEAMESDDWLEPKEEEKEDEDLYSVHNFSL